MSVPDRNSEQAGALARKAADAIALHMRGGVEEAERLYREILAADPGYVDALHMLGVLRTQQGRLDEAIDLIGEAIRRNPGFAPAHNNLGNALTRGGRHREAVESYRQAVAIRPGFADAHCNLADALRVLRRDAEALESYRRGLALQPARAPVHFRLATLLHALGRIEEALASYRRVIAIEPDHAEAHHGLGVALAVAGRHAEAVAALKRVLALKPDHGGAAADLGAALRALGSRDEALEACRRAVALDPGSTVALNNLGNALTDLGRGEEAIDCYRRALASRPDDAEVHGNLGMALVSVNRLDEAKASLGRAIDLRPDHAVSRYNLGLVHLAAGDLPAGWEGYEQRWKAGVARVRVEIGRPLWRGDEPLAGKTILLHAEQGYGDTLQFVRYVPLVACRGARVILQVPSRLKALIAGISGAASVIGRNEPLPEHDLQCPLMSLPRAFGTSLEDIPAAIPYLHAPAAAVERWAKRLADASRPRVGLVWAGRRDHVNDRNRSMPLAQLAAVLAVAGPSFFSLQRELGPGDSAGLRGLARIVHLGNQLEDFADSAGAISCLDLVIAVDTAVAHLAGALGKDVWILLPFSPDWRWMLQRSDSPWYPTARLLRQERPGDWVGVIDRVARLLSGWTTARSQ